MPIPLKGDRSAFDDINYPLLHSADLDAGTPIHHLPSDADEGEVPVWVTDHWEAGAIVIPPPPTLAETAIAYGDADDEITGDAAILSFDAPNCILKVGSDAVLDTLIPGIYSIGDAMSARVAAASFGGAPTFSGWKAGGTVASPTDVLDTEELLILSSVGYADGSWRTARNIIKSVATENWTATERGAKWVFQATPIGGETSVDALDLSGELATINVPVLSTVSENIFPTAMYIGPELITNGDFGTGDFTGWTAGATWSVISNVAWNIAVGKKGMGNLESDTFTVEKGAIYKVEFDCDIAGSSISVGINNQGWTAGPGDSVVGYYESDADEDVSLIVGFTYSDAGIDNISVKKITVPLNVMAATDQPFIQRWITEDGVVGSGITKEGLFYCDLGGHQSCLFIGKEAGLGNESYYNLGIGYRALGATGLTQSYNTAIGCEALSSNTTGHNNVAIGYAALKENVDGYYNFAVGAEALTNTVSAKNNTSIGAMSSRYKISGNYECFIGLSAGSNSHLGSYNVGIGAHALSGNSVPPTNTFSYNVGIGSYVLPVMTSGLDNVAIGSYSGMSLTTGSENIFIGYKSGYRQTTLSNRLILDNQQRATAAEEATNAIIYGVMAAAPASQTLALNAVVAMSQGMGSQLKIVGSSDQIQLIVKGYSSQTTDLQQWQNSSGTVVARVDAYGRFYAPLTGSTSSFYIGGAGGGSTMSGSSNVGIGNLALYAVGSGLQNIAVGPQALYKLTTAIRNTAIGGSALQANKTGDTNTALGAFAMYYMNGGTDNFAMGFNCLSEARSGYGNIVMGSRAGYNSYTANYNTIFGYGADLIAPGSGMTATAVAGAGLEIGKYWYKVSFTLDGANSGLSYTTSEVTTTAGNQQVNLASIPTYTGPLTCSARKIYRTKVIPAGSDPLFYLCTTISDNTTTTFSDTVADASLVTAPTGEPSGSFAFGTYATITANGQCVFGNGSAQNVANFYLGQGVYAASSAGVTINATGGYGTDNAGAPLTLAGGKSTGTAAGGSIVFKTSPAGASSSLANSLVEFLRISTTEVIVNDTGNAAIDFRVESDTEANMIFLDANGDTDGALYLGGSTNGIKINKGGVASLLGTAKRHLSMRPTMIPGKTSTPQKPTPVDRGAGSGFSLPLYAADEEIFCNEYIAGRWDGASDITFSVICYLDTAETDGDDFALQLSWANKSTASGIWPDTTTDVVVETNCASPRNAQFSIFKVEFTIDWDTVDPDVTASDFFCARLRRIAVAGGGAVEIAGEVVVLGFVITYAVDKIFKA